MGKRKITNINMLLDNEKIPTAIADSPIRWVQSDAIGHEVFSWKTAPVGEIIRRKKALDFRNRELGVELKHTKIQPAWEFPKNFNNKTALSNLRLKTLNALRKEQA